MTIAPKLVSTPISSKSDIMSHLLSVALVAIFPTMFCFRNLSVMLTSCVFLTAHPTTTSISCNGGVKFIHSSLKRINCPRHPGQPSNDPAAPNKATIPARAKKIVGLPMD